MALREETLFSYGKLSLGFIVQSEDRTPSCTNKLQKCSSTRKPVVRFVRARKTLSVLSALTIVHYFLLKAVMTSHNVIYVKTSF